MQEERTVNERYLTSFGAMRTTMSYISEKEACKLQGLNQFMYNHGVGRAVTKIHLHPPIFFLTDTLPNTLFCLNPYSYDITEKAIVNYGADGQQSFITDLEAQLV